MERAKLAAAVAEELRRELRSIRYSMYGFYVVVIIALVIVAVD